MWKSTSGLGCVGRPKFDFHTGPAAVVPEPGTRGANHEKGKTSGRTSPSSYLLQVIAILKLRKQSLERSSARRTRTASFLASFSRMMLKRTSTPCAASLRSLRVRATRRVGRVRNGQIRIHRIAWKDTLGPTVARHPSETLYANETYVISFDSHTNFAHGWDVIAIDMFKRISNPRAIVTTYPASYSATEHSERWKDFG